MSSFRPKYITFDCYGTLTRFRMGEMAREMFADRIPADCMDAFIRDFASYRLDEVLGPWKPYRDVLVNSILRTAKLWGIKATEAEGEAYYLAVPTWGPHADVPAGLSKIADKIPLVILSNASNDQIHSNVEKLGAPFHRVYTAQMAQAYKPRMQAFEYMLDQLGCAPEHILHVSSSYRYDLMTAHDLRFGMRAFVNRGHEPLTPYYGAVEIPDIGGLPGLVGL
ncbi:MAG: haloacid dehalogenase type II [Beijerinckiaceae bacterium]|nr:haloacid dehalogenase type II [Beijerinckiaceae bacterium]MCZ8301685.1 haloacid dehalogenase type II [Beijerinckiaceae bacterium]